MNVDVVARSAYYRLDADGTASIEFLDAEGNRMTGVPAR
jgi:hypothetical protein